MECGGRAQRRPRFGFFHPRRSHSPNGDSHRTLPNGPPSPGGPRSAKRSLSLGHQYSGGVGTTYRASAQSDLGYPTCGALGKRTSSLGRGQGDLPTESFRWGRGRLPTFWSTASPHRTLVVFKARSGSRIEHPVRHPVILTYFDLF